MIFVRLGTHERGLQLCALNDCLLNKSSLVTCVSLNPREHFELGLRICLRTTINQSSYFNSQLIKTHLKSRTPLVSVEVIRKQHCVCH